MEEKLSVGEFLWNRIHKDGIDKDIVIAIEVIEQLERIADALEKISKK